MPKDYYESIKERVREVTPIQSINIIVIEVNNIKHIDKPKGGMEPTNKITCMPL